MPPRIEPSRLVPVVPLPAAVLGGAGQAQTPFSLKAPEAVAGGAAVAAKAENALVQNGAREPVCSLPTFIEQELRRAFGTAATPALVRAVTGVFEQDPHLAQLALRACRAAADHRHASGSAPFD